MSYQPGQNPQYPPPAPQQPYHVQLQQPVTDQSKRFLNLSVGALIAIISGLLLVCCVGPIAFCFLSPVLGGMLEATKVKPDVEITSCRMDAERSLPAATVGLRITNKGKSTESYVIKVEVRDAAGSRLGDGSEFVASLAPGSSATEETVVYLSGGVGSTCHVVDVT